MIIFGELVSSENFFRLFAEHLNILSGARELGLYFQGIPVRPGMDLVWGTNAGSRTAPILAGLWLLQLVFGKNWDVVYLLIAISLPFLLTYVFLSRYSNLKYSSFLAAIFYSTNTFVVNRLFTGFWQLNIAYAFVPVSILSPIMPQMSNPMRVCLTGLSLAVLLTAQPHFLLICLFFWMIELTRALLNNRSYFNQLVRRMSWGVATMLCLTGFFWLPSLFFPEHKWNDASQYFSYSYLKGNSEPVILPNLLKLNTSATGDKSELIQYSQLVFVGLCFLIQRPKDWTNFWLLIFFLFLAKGLNPPLSELSNVLYQHIYPLHFFRDPSRFMAAAVFAGSLLIMKTKIFNHKLLKYAVLICFILVQFLNVKPIVSTFYTRIQKAKIPPEYYEMQQFINFNLNETDRILVLPGGLNFFKYDWLKSDSPPWHASVYEALLPLKASVVLNRSLADTWSSQVTAYLVKRFTETYDTSIISLLSVNYLLIDRNIESPIPQFTDSSQLKLLKKFNNVELWQINLSSPIVSNTKPIFGIGDLSLLTSYSPIILLNQQGNSTFFDMDMFKGKEFVTNVSNPVLWWSAERLANKFSLDIKREISYNDTLFSNYEPFKLEHVISKSSLFSSGKSLRSSGFEGTLNVKHQLKSGNYRVLAKFITRSRNKAVLTLSTKDINKNLIMNSDDMLIWQDFGSISIDSKISRIKIIKRDKNDLILDHLLLVPELDFIKSINESVQALSQMIMIPLEKSMKQKSEFLGFAIYTDLVSVNTPSRYLNYGYTFGRHWTASSGAMKFVVNGYGMSFISDHSDISFIRYGPNAYYKYSLYFSFAVFILVLSIISFKLVLKWRI